MRQSAFSGSPLEPIMGFARAVRIGNIAAVAGTAPRLGQNGTSWDERHLSGHPAYRACPLDPDGETVGIGDVAAQTQRCLEISRIALEQIGVPLSAVLRTRTMLTDITRWEEAARVHGEYFAETRPVCTFVEVKGFVRPEWLVETEIDPVVGD